MIILSNLPMHENLILFAENLNEPSWDLNVSRIKRNIQLYLLKLTPK
jgi:hypothetical protein